MPWGASGRSPEVLVTPSRPVLQPTKTAVIEYAAANSRRKHKGSAARREYAAYHAGQSACIVGSLRNLLAAPRALDYQCAHIATEEVALV